MYVDTHTHLSPYSHDARQSVAELLAQAARKGLSAVCTADHYEKDIFYEGGREDIFNITDYFRDLGAVQAARKDEEPRLLPGVELGYLPHLDRHYAQVAAAWPFNSVILSLHILESQDPFVLPAMYHPGKTDVYGRYLRQLTTMITSCPDFDIIGHFDYITRYAPYTDRKIRYDEFPAAFDELFSQMIRNRKALEINTRTIVKLQSCGYEGYEAWPDPAIISRYLDLGGNLISLGSDAHKAGECGHLFPETIAWLSGLGCRQVVHFEKRQAVFTQITDYGEQ